MESRPLTGHTLRSDARAWDRPDDDGVRVADYDRWRRYAGGDQWRRRKAADPPTLLVANYARALVHKVASYVFPAAPTFDIAGADDEARSEPEALLNRLVQELGLAELDLSLEAERSIIGDAAVKVTWDARQGRPRVVSVDPGGLSVRYSPADPREAVEVTHHYQMPGFALREFGFDILNDDAWVAVAEIWNDREWSMRVAGVSDPVVRPNPYGWIPYLVLANNPHPRRFWGESDLVAVEPVADAINRELSILGAVMDLSGAPIAVLENVDGSDGITARPGAKWELPEGSRAYLLDLLSGGGVRLHIDYLGELMRTMHDLAETPRTAFGDSGRALSGAALEVEIQPLVQRVRRKRASWERFYQQRNRRLLDLLAADGQPVGAHRVTITNWAPILPSDESEMVRNQVQLVASSIRSRRKAAEALGETDPEAELDQILAEAKRLAQVAPDPVVDEETAPATEPVEGEDTT